MATWHPDCTCYSSCECCCLCMGEDGENGYAPSPSTAPSEPSQRPRHPYAVIERESTGANRPIMNVGLPPASEDA